MNERINFQELVALLSAEKNITKKDAEVFLRELFSLIAEGIVTDSNVKIKNWGAFKVTDISARESVNIQSGKRVVIPAHKKVSFTPDKILSELVNSPYAHLEITELENIPEKSEAEPDEALTPSEQQPERQPEEVVEEAPVTEEEAVAEEKLTPTEEPFHLPDETQVEKNKENFRKRHPVILAVFVLSLFAAIALGLYIFTMKSSRNEYIDTLREVADRATAVNNHPQSMPRDTIIPFSGGNVSATKKDTVAVEEKEPVTEEKRITINRGERLTLISLREYGDKVFWVYLYIANKDVIEDPNSVAPGTVIKVPAPETYDIDKNKRESILKATKLMQEILSSTAKR